MMLLFVDKPTGMTSYGVIRRLKKNFPGQKIGHAGTLDPLATGLLILGIGKDTKQLGQLIGLDKSYVAKIDLSQGTDTRDSDFWQDHRVGNVSVQGEKSFFVHPITMKSVDVPSQDQIENLLAEMLKVHEFPLPPFCAKKQGGKKLYDLAKEGHAVLETRPMKVYSSRLITYAFPLVDVEFFVGSGCYIRSLAYWLGQQLGMGGIIVSLRRISIGHYTVEDAKSLEEIEKMKV